MPNQTVQQAQPMDMDIKHAVQMNGDKVIFVFFFFLDYIQLQHLVTEEAEAARNHKHQLNVQIGQWNSKQELNL
jgi:hypothetical protein